MRARYTLLCALAVLALALIPTLLPPQGGRSALAAACTLYASPTGSDSNNGLTVSTPKTLSGAAHASTPGSVVCLEGGTYNSSSEFDLPVSGTSTGWITYQSYDPANVAHLVWTGAALNTGMWFIYNTSSNPNGTNYIKIDDLWFDAANLAAQAIKCSSSHHITVSNTYITNAGEAGVMMHHCDYTTIDHNWVFHSGYNQGTSSGIDVHDNTYWYDQAAGFHSYITNNIVSGSYDNEPLPNQTEGNGIILDSSDIGIINTPPELIANNVVLENGGYCIVSFQEYGHWIVNNTCYKNSLDLYVHNGSTAAYGKNGEMYSDAGESNTWVNNIAVSWDKQQPLVDSVYGTGSTASTWDYNLWYDGDDSTVTNGLNSNSSVVGLVHGNPLFTSAPTNISYTGNVTTDNNQESTAPDPTTIGSDFALQAGSPAIGTGVDPTSLTTDSALKSGLQQYLYTDIVGNSRPVGGPFDLGAYEYQGTVPTATPTNTATATATAIATNAPTPTDTPTNTPTPTTTATSTPTNTPTNTPVPCPVGGPEPVIWRDVTNATVSGSSLTAPSTNTYWGSGADGVQAARSGTVYVTFTATSTTTGAMVGLNHDETGASYSDIDYGLYLQNNGIVSIYENGSSIQTFGSYAVGDSFKVVVASGVAKYYQNGTLLYTSLHTPVYPLFADAALRDANSDVASVMFWP